MDTSASTLCLFLVGIMIIMEGYSQNEYLYCGDAYECANATHFGKGNIYLQGYRSGINADRLDAWEDISCTGDSSCKNVKLVTNRLEMDCDGFQSCANIDRIVKFGDIYCTGVQSCINSVIEIKETTGRYTSGANQVDCTGYQSCMNSELILSQYLLATGSYSVANSLISIWPQVTANKRIYIRMYGYYSALNTRFQCNGMVTCQFECHHNACQDSFFVCNPESTCTMYFAREKYRPFVPLPKQINASQINQTLLAPNILALPDQDAAMHGIGQLCKNTDIYARNDYLFFEPNQPKILNDTIFGNISAICLRSRAKPVPIVTNQSVDVSCSGSGSCNYALIDTRLANTVHCTGNGACVQTTIRSGGNVFCGARSSCSWSKIYTKGNLTCDGTASCSTTTIYAHVPQNNAKIELRFAGYNSGAWAKVYMFCDTYDANNDCYVHCLGADACKQMVLTCSGQCHVQCNNVTTSCPKIIKINGSEEKELTINTTEIMQTNTLDENIQSTIGTSTSTTSDADVGTGGGDGAGNGNGNGVGVGTTAIPATFSTSIKSDESSSTISHMRVYNRLFCHILCSFVYGLLFLL